MNSPLMLKHLKKASGKPTIYIDGYPTGDGLPMSATDFHGRQISTFSDQLRDYFENNPLVYVGTDSFVYYDPVDKNKKVAPDIYVVLGVSSFPARRSFYTWAEGASPTVVFEFLSEETEKEDKGEKLRKYFEEIGVLEYFVHQPEGTAPVEFRGWRRTETGIEEIPEDARELRKSEALELWFGWEEQPDKVRLLRPYLPDGTPLPTLAEAHRHAREAVRAQREAEEHAQEAEERAQEAVRAQREAEERAQESAHAQREAEELAREEARKRAELEAELSRLREELRKRGQSA
ncbi:Uma2 family endonuclease [Candidatus Poribacteria bacterium]|nr:Uma2 family endonuclease [Candidatus Poribacteria bacterium]